MPQIPRTQHAVELTGPDQLSLNTAKVVHEPSDHQILCRVIVCGLCFSDLKLLKQFSEHARKSEVLSGVDPGVLRGLPSYVPGTARTVPGHEPTVEIVKVGKKVRAARPGERFVIQADWRWLKTTSSNGALGYNFEGALQEYVLLDDRIIVSPEGESMLLPAADTTRSMAAYGLVEPWACVENAYQSPQRRRLADGGRMLVVTDVALPSGAVEGYVSRFGKPGSIAWVGAGAPAQIAGLRIGSLTLSSLGESPYDDILYVGSSRQTLETLFPRLAVGGLVNIVLWGGRFGSPVTTPLGQVHYAGIRITGSAGQELARGMDRIPETGEMRRGDRVHIVGAGGPMGVMHVMRDLCQGVPEVEILGSDLSPERLVALDHLAKPVASARGLRYESYNPKAGAPAGGFSYVTVMAPVPAIVAQAVREATSGGIINIFAGIPAGVSGEIDLDAYLEKELYVFGTSGSLMRDMKTVLRKVAEGTLDTNVSVAAISGLDGAVEGIRAVEKQLIPGKILVYPACKGLGLTRLSDLPAVLPDVAAKLHDGVWTPAAERALLARYGA
jgi:threonine dehydrogenase-like Zn-dependent dehydrogenase